MAQLTVATLLHSADRLGLELVAGPGDGPPITRVAVTTLTGLRDLEAGVFAIISGDDPPAHYLVDVALRQASARELSGIVLPGALRPGETALAFADAGGVSVMTAPHVTAPALAVAVDRVLSGGAAESMTRAAYAIEQATAAAGRDDASADDILIAAGAALGTTLHLADDATAQWTDGDAVFVGEVPIGRVAATTDDPAAAVVVPVIASLVSRAMQRQLRDRFAPTQSRSELIVELVLAEAARVEGFIGPAARLGLPLQLSHAVAWLRPRRRSDVDAAPPRAVEAAVELFTLQLIETRPELWHVAFIQDDAVIVATEEYGAGDHQRRLRDVAERVQAYATSVAGDDWTYTLGLGTPQTGAAGLRQSAAEARVAADTAIAAGRLGGIELTDVTGLRRVLLDFYASPISRNLLQDVLHPLDEWGPERADTAVRTLLAYLQHRNSLVGAGRVLTLHPNAVGYRLRRIREAMGVDLDDPDIRFTVELACRVRLLGTTRG